MKFFVLCFGFAIFGIANTTLLGAPTQLTDTDKLKYLVDKVKSHLVTLNDKPNHPQLEYVSHNSATYQSVNGILYKMSGTLKENDQQVNCLLELWEKPWLNFEKFTANCGEEEKRTYESIVGEERRRKRSPTVLLVPQGIPEENWPKLNLKMETAFTQRDAEHNRLQH